jgi:hypothetical protein
LGRFIKFITFIKEFGGIFTDRCCFATNANGCPEYGGKFQMSSLLLNEMWLDCVVWFYTYRIFWLTRAGPSDLIYLLLFSNQFFFINLSSGSGALGLSETLASVPLALALVPYKLAFPLWPKWPCPF